MVIPVATYLLLLACICNRCSDALFVVDTLWHLQNIGKRCSGSCYYTRNLKIMISGKVSTHKRYLFVCYSFLIRKPNTRRILNFKSFFELLISKHNRLIQCILFLLILFIFFFVYNHPATQTSIRKRV